MSSQIMTSATAAARIDLSGLDHYAQLGVTWIRRANQRRQLRTLETRLLADIGITYEQALTEANKPFWVK